MSIRLPRICRPSDTPLTAAQQATGRRRVTLYAMVAMFSWGVVNPRVMSLLALRLDSTLDNRTLALLFTIMSCASIATALLGPLVDRYGKKAVLVPFYIAATFAVMALTALPSLDGVLEPRTLVWTMMGMLAVYSLLRSCGSAGWFPLINDSVPPDIRGRFFGKLRTCWQLVLFAVTLTIGWFLGKEPAVWQFQVLLGVAVIGNVARMAAAASVPEAPLVKGPGRGASMKRLLRPLRNRSYRNFMAFSALVAFSVGFQGPFVIRILKDELDAGDGMMMLVSAFMSIGAVASLYVSGWLVDRFGSRFVVALYAPPMAMLNLIWVFINRDMAAWHVWAGLCLFGGGALFFGITVALTNLMLASAGRRYRAAYLNVSIAINSIAAGLGPLVAAAVATAWTHTGMDASTGLSDNRAVFLLRIVLMLLPLALLPYVSRRHGGRIRASAGQFSQGLAALGYRVLRGRNP